MTTWAQPTTFARVWANAVQSRPDEPFLIFEGPGGAATAEVTEWTYADFDREIQRVAARLAELGVVAGSSVHMALTNSPTFMAVWLASVRMGAWIVPSDPMGRAPELADHLSRTTPTVGFCARSRADVYRAAAESSDSQVAIVEIDEGDVTLDPFPRGAHYDNWAEPALTDRAAVMFTSGTTGRPKGVEITQANYAFAGCTMAEAAVLTPEDRLLVVLPLFHANAQYYSFASAIWAGAGVALMPTFSASGFLPQVVRHRATVASLFAAPLRMILARGGPVGLTGLRHCWFAQNISSDQYRTVTEWFGCRPRQLYGMTETIPAVLTDRPYEPRPDSMGFVTAGCEVEVHDADGGPAADGETGDIVVGGEPGVTLFAGYLDDPETTARNFRDSWFLTGDRGRRHSDGRFFFDGRRSDVLKVAGENVSTVEVETVLAAHPGILEVSVVGAPDPILDEVPVAFVVPAAPANPPTEEELHAWCRDRLGPAKRPHRIAFMESLPRTSVGKIRTFLLKQSLLQEEANS